jgi:lysine-ketoglutarate reductase/saccharopine dehydrogenase-like protein (TIGR00300 family)
MDWKGVKMDRDIRLYGHLIDSQILSRVLDAIAAAGATHEILSLRVGRTRQDASEAVLRIFAEDALLMEKAVSLVREMGAELLDSAPAVCQPAPADGVLPERFYATTNLPTEVLVDKEWITVDGEEMDLAVVVSPDRRSARGIPMAEVRKGEMVVVGEQGVRVRTLAPESASPEFRFMASEVSAEKPKGPLLHRVLRTMRRVREEGKKILLVGGPAIVHTGAAPILEKLIHDGWVDILFAGNALAAHDIEQALLGTSLGVPVDSSSPLPAGHAHHLWAINAIRREGSIAAAVESGLLKKTSSPTFSPPSRPCAGTCPPSAWRSWWEQPFTPSPPATSSPPGYSPSASTSIPGRSPSCRTAAAASRSESSWMPPPFWSSWPQG